MPIHVAIPLIGDLATLQAGEPYGSDYYGQIAKETPAGLPYWVDDSGNLIGLTANIYRQDGDLIADRTLEGANFFLTMQNLSTFTVGAVDMVLRMSNSVVLGPVGLDYNMPAQWAPNYLTEKILVWSDANTVTWEDRPTTLTGVLANPGDLITYAGGTPVALAIGPVGYVLTVANDGISVEWQLARNIYSIDGTLTGPREVNQGAFDLTFKSTASPPSMIFDEIGVSTFSPALQFQLAGTAKMDIGGFADGIPRHGIRIVDANESLALHNEQTGGAIDIWATDQVNVKSGIVSIGDVGSSLEYHLPVERDPDYTGGKLILWDAFDNPQWTSIASIFAVTYDVLTDGNLTINLARLGGAPSTLSNPSQGEYTVTAQSGAHVLSMDINGDNTILNPSSELIIRLDNDTNSNYRKFSTALYDGVNNAQVDRQLTATVDVQTEEPSNVTRILIPGLGGFGGFGYNLFLR